MTDAEKIRLLAAALRRIRKLTNLGDQRRVIAAEALRKAGAHV